MHLSCAETHCSAHSLGLSFHPPPPPLPNNERVEFIVRSLAASVIKPDCNQKGGSFLSERRRGASSLAGCIHDSAQEMARTQDDSSLTDAALSPRERNPTPRRAATIQFVGFGTSGVASVAIYGPAGRALAPVVHAAV